MGLRALPQGPNSCEDLIVATPVLNHQTCVSIIKDSINSVWILVKTVLGKCVYISEDSIETLCALVRTVCVY